MIWECFGSGKTFGETQISGFAKGRRGPVLLRRGTRLYQGKGATLGRGKFQFLGFCPGGSGHTSATLCGVLGGPESSGLVLGDTFELVSNGDAICVL